jgi:hypothetical protein
VAATDGSGKRGREDRHHHRRRITHQWWRKIRGISSPLHVRLGGRLSRRDIWHQGIADFAFNCVRVRSHRDPARRGSDPAWRNRRGALCRHRWHGQSGSRGAVFPAVGAVDPERYASGGVQTVLQESGRLRHGGRRRRAGAGKLRGRNRARRADSWRRCRLRRADRLVSPHAFEPGRQADHRLRAQCSGRRRHDGGTDRLYQCPRHGDAGKRQDGIFEHFRRVRRPHLENSGLVQQIDGRPHDFGGGRGGGDFFAADARTSTHSADHQLRNPRPRDPVRRRAQQGPRRPRDVWL